MLQRVPPAAQRIGVDRPATALAESDPADTVCRQTATKVNGSELLTVRFNALLGGDFARTLRFRVYSFSTGSMRMSCSAAIRPISSGRGLESWLSFLKVSWNPGGVVVSRKDNGSRPVFAMP